MILRQGREEDSGRGSDFQFFISDIYIYIYIIQAPVGAEDGVWFIWGPPARSGPAARNRAISRLARSGTARVRVSGARLGAVSLPAEYILAVASRGSLSLSSLAPSLPLLFLGTFAAATLHARINIYNIYIYIYIYIYTNCPAQLSYKYLPTARRLNRGSRLRLARESLVRAPERSA